jgi:hypothetical protein
MTIQFLFRDWHVAAAFGLCPACIACGRTLLPDFWYLVAAVSPRFSEILVSSKTKGSFMNKTFNLIIMVLMFALAAREGYLVAQNGANATNVIFLLLFLAFGVRRLMIHNKLSK